MFDRATIRLGIGPHSSSVYVFCLTLSVVSYTVLCDLRLIYISQIWPDKFLFVENRNIFAPLCEPIG